MSRRRLHRWAAPLALVAVALTAGAAFAVTRIATPPAVARAAADNTVGDAVCLSCHRDKESFESTGHRLTTQTPVRSAIAGSFAPGHNVLRTGNPDLHFQMDSTRAGFYEVAVAGHARDTSRRAERIAYVVGSGRKGQSYLYWQGDRLYELPVSYWTGLHTWINSPGYQDGTANFDRPAMPRCLECHATSFQNIPDLTAGNRYQKGVAILGITCEECHGAGRQHVAVERSPLRGVLRSIQPPAIANPARLARQRQLDGCALCHGGLGQPLVPSFSYVPGQPLAPYVQLAEPPPTASVDVHGNQIALLERSRCFQSSQMTCATCHDVHRAQRDTVALSDRCLTCHTVQSCGLFAQGHYDLRGRCVGCHMPALPSRTIVSTYQGRQEQPKVRTHWIKVYPQISQ